jgi:hypothetical protein
MDNAILELSKQILIYSIINSFVVYGILETVKKIYLNSIHRFVGLIITYVLGMVMGFMFSGVDTTWHKIIWGLCLGGISIGIYKTAIKSLLEIIPTLMNRFVK